MLGTQALCDAARRVGVERFHHISTCEVYGDLALDSDESFTELSPYRPRTPYNASKAGSDHVVRCYGETFGLPVTISNCCNNYGPYQFPEKVIPLFATRALGGEPLPLYASVANRREWLHVDDHCRAIDAVLRRGRVRRDLQRRARASRPRSRRSPTVCSPAVGAPGVAEDDRSRPSRSRPAVPARLFEDPCRARLVRRRSSSPRGSPRRSTGTGRTRRGGGRSSAVRRSSKGPGGRRPTASGAPADPPEKALGTMMRVLVTGARGQLGTRGRRRAGAPVGGADEEPRFRGHRLGRARARRHRSRRRHDGDRRPTSRRSSSTSPPTPRSTPARPSATAPGR